MSKQHSSLANLVPDHQASKTILPHCTWDFQPKAQWGQIFFENWKVKYDFKNIVVTLCFRPPIGSNNFWESDMSKMWLQKYFGHIMFQTSTQQHNGAKYFLKFKINWKVNLSSLCLKPKSLWI